MTPTLQTLIPGIREAEARYRSEAQEAFADFEPKICGMVEISPLTPLMMTDLEGGENRFVAGEGTADAGDIGVLLWRCSPFYKRGDDSLRRFFQANLAPLPYDKTREEIAEYLRRSLGGMPLWRRDGSASSVATWQSRLVHSFAKEYGWTEEYILNRPFRRLWQYANRMLESEDPKYSERCPEALRIRAAWLVQANTAPAHPGRN